MLSLVEPTLEHEAAYNRMIDIWKAHESIPTSPSTIFAGTSYSEFLQYIDTLKHNPPSGKVPASFFFVMKDGEIIGGVDIRHTIEGHEYLTKLGGHIGYGILPTERGK